MSHIKNFLKRFGRKVQRDNELGARKAVLEDMFYEFNRSRVQVYKMNFIRGIFFGLGSVLGGTVIVALVVWILSLFVDFPGIGHTIESLQQTINGR